MKRLAAGLVIGFCLFAVPRAHASTIGFTTGAKYACSVENCGTDLNKAATSTFVTVQQQTLARVSAGEYSGTIGGVMPPLGSPIGTVDTLAQAVGSNPEPASMLLLGTGIAGLFIRRRKNQASA